MIRWDETKESSLNWASDRYSSDPISEDLYLQEGETVLHVAATSGQLETVEALLDRGCDANVQDFVSL